MTIVIFILCLLVLGVMGTRTYYAVDSRKTYGLSAKQVDHVSWAGKMVLKTYHELPKDNRPEANVPAIIKALDIKYSVQKVDEHFARSERDYMTGGRTNTYAWSNCNCSGYRNAKCTFPEYREMAKAIAEIQDAITAQRRALEVAAVGNDLENALALTERLREERDLINKVTETL